MVTPFTSEGALNYAEAERLADYLVTHGSSSLVVCGTTGESPTLTWAEEYELFRVVRDTIAGRAKLIAGTGSNSTREAIAATHEAARLGVDGTLQVVPYYNKPPQAGLLAHFRTIAQAADIPLLLYNIPGRTGVGLQAETVAELAQVSTIIGIKEASGGTEMTSQVRRLTNPEFAIYAGDDSLTLPLLALGAVGVVSVASHLVGIQLEEMIQAFVQGHPDKALSIHCQLMPLFKDLFLETNPIPVKAALAMQGWQVGGVRLPLVASSVATQATLRQTMKTLNLVD
ncbi:MAG: 4-hydroxy-tetrahydrodipicolinate synthase [Synechococcales cyanobacterium]